MKKADIITIGLAIGFLLPIIGVAGIVIHNDTGAASTTSGPGMVYLQPGPDYEAVNSAGFITINGNATASPQLSVSFSDSSSSSMVNLVNVFSINDKYPAAKVVDVNLTGTLPSGVMIYVSSSEMVSSGTVITGNSLVSRTGSFSVNLQSSSNGTIFYIGFQVESISGHNGSIALSSQLK